MALLDQIALGLLVTTVVVVLGIAAFATRIDGSMALIRMASRHLAKQTGNPTDDLIFRAIDAGTPIPSYEERLALKLEQDRLGIAIEDRNHSEVLADIEDGIITQEEFGAVMTRVGESQWTPLHLPSVESSELAGRRMAAAKILQQGEILTAKSFILKYKSSDGIIHEQRFGGNGLDYYPLPPEKKTERTLMWEKEES